MDANSNTEGSADKKRILIIGAGLEGKSALAMMAIEEKYGNDVVIVTPEEAKEQGLKDEDFVNTKMKFELPPIIPMTRLVGDYPTGQERRRERRKKERSKARWR